MTIHDMDGIANPFWKEFIGMPVTVKATVGARNVHNNTISLLNTFVGEPQRGNRLIIPTFPFRQHLWINSGKKWKHFESGDIAFFTARINTYQKVVNKETKELIRKITLNGITSLTRQG